MVAQVTAWPSAVQPGSLPVASKVNPLARVSLTLNPPLLSDGPSLLTVMV